MHPDSLCQYIVQGARGNDRSDVWWDIFDLYWRAAFSGHFGEARRLLEVYFGVVGPDFKVANLAGDNGVNRCLATIWAHAPAAKPFNVPAWVAGAGPFTDDEVPEYDISRPEFYEKWPEKYWIPSYGFLKPDKHDPHAWRTSQDHWECAACARLLCRVPQGQVPDRAAIEEAFEAIERLRTQLPCRKPGESEGLYSPPDQSEVARIVPDDIYLPFLLGLGLRDRAWEMFCNSEIRNWRRLPALYDMCLRQGRYLPLIERDDAKSAVDKITAAFISRQENGRFDPLKPLMDLGWSELLRRFSEAALQYHAKAYSRIKNPPRWASDILFPPITPELLAQAEQRLGPLPSDLKEMAQVANGFRGPLHRLGRGFPGLDKFKIEACDSWYENFLTDEDRGLPRPSSEALEAPIWIAYVGKGIETAYQHLICPPDTWRKLVGNEHATDGEYRVQCQIAWAYRHDWPDTDAFKGVRHWVASETFKMEGRLGRRERGERDEETDEDEDEDDEGETDEEEDEAMEE